MLYYKSVRYFMKNNIFYIICKKKSLIGLVLNKGKFILKFYTQKNGEPAREEESKYRERAP